MFCQHLGKCDVIGKKIIYKISVKIFPHCAKTIKPNNI